MSKQSKQVTVIVVAAGRGTRAKTSSQSVPKQYQVINGIPMLKRTITNFLEMEHVNKVLAVIHPDDTALYNGLNLKHGKLLEPISGGASRQLSVHQGLQSLVSSAPDFILIHDAARPFVSQQTVSTVLDGLKTHDAVLPVTKITDTIKRSSDGLIVSGTEDREQLFAAQTPQGFSYKAILEAHDKAAKCAQTFTDDAAIAEWANIPVALAPGNTDNIKITNPEDFHRAEKQNNGHMLMETRVGSGIDIHQFEPGDSVTLGGVTIPHTAKLKGHSDADAALHVLTDALLGALADGDIGTHFPPSDPKWKGEQSQTFLQFATKRVTDCGGRIVHLDLTIMCEFPKIGPHTQKLRHSIGQICDISPTRVSVKATTAEKMGFVGRAEGLLTMGTATIEIPRGED